MQITYKICKVKDVYDKVLKNVTCKFRKVLSKSVKMSKEVGKVLKSVQISPCRNQQPAGYDAAWAEAIRDLKIEQSINDICDYIL